MKTALILAVLVLSACAGHSFVPYEASRAEAGPKVVLRAVQAYPGDLPKLVDAGGVLLGLVKTHEHQHAELFAAKAGGTHVLLVKGKAAYRFLTSSGPQDVAFPSSGYAVVRVGPDAWTALPPALQPHAIPPAVSADCECTLDQSGVTAWRLSCPGEKPELEPSAVKQLCS